MEADMSPRNLKVPHAQEKTSDTQHSRSALCGSYRVPPRVYYERKFLNAAPCGNALQLPIENQ